LVAVPQGETKGYKHTVQIHSVIFCCVFFSTAVWAITMSYPFIIGKAGKLIGML